MLAIGPDLALMHGVNTFGKCFEGFVTEDDAVRAAAEGVDDQFAFAGSEEHDGARFGLKSAEFAEDAKTFERTFMQLRADDGNVWLALLEESESIVIARRWRRRRHESAWAGRRFRPTGNSFRLLRR